MSAKLATHNGNPKATKEQLEFRQKVLGEILEEAAIRKDIVDQNYLLMHMRDRGFPNYTGRMLYDDRLAIDSQNTYIRDFLPRYSQVQADIYRRLEEWENELVAIMAQRHVSEKHHVKRTKDGEFRSVITEDVTTKVKIDCMKVGAKILELKQKHTEGQNIQISAVIIQKELATKKKQILELTEENKKLSIKATKNEK